MSFFLPPANNPAREHPATGNRRATLRFHCPPATAGRLLLFDRLEYRRAWVVDLGAQGVGLLLDKELPVGQLVVVYLKGPATGRTFELAARLAHCTPQPAGDFLVGCAFAKPLTNEDLDELL